MHFRSDHNRNTTFGMVLRVILVAIISFAVASFFDVFEHLEEIVEEYEHLNIDELFVVGVLLALWMLGEFAFLVRRLRKQSKILNEFATIDTLTGLYNRRGFFSLAETKLFHSKKNDDRFKVVFLDVNKFKVINDSYGHAVGDEVLIRIANFLREKTYKDDILARIGGDEFIVITSHEIEKDYLERLEKNVVLNSKSLAEPLLFKLSYGIACHLEDGNSIDELLHVADQRMYEMKHNIKTDSQKETGDESSNSPAAHC